MNKLAILHNNHKLKGLSISIKKAFSQETMEISLEKI